MEIDAHRVVRGGLGREFAIIDGTGSTLARAKQSWYGRRAAFDVNGKGYIGYVKRWNEAVLEDAEGANILVVRWALLKPAMRFEYQGCNYELSKEGWGYLHYLYRNGSTKIGGFDQRGRYPTKWLVRFADDLPLAINVFLLWLVAGRWRAADTTV
jgi:hypothetical protein